ncbi:restriction endonuclease [Novacetimonas maltaceti]|uniref:Type-2 restriction enzyme EcoRII n=1 Tax=Novacetimonas maltaceti TaxID=1203393 RepID=A0A2S3VYE9_9PROT|nr:type II restriction endonuclease [Novacetimonas maltaceti]POF61630.1 Type-2 restriction enzyme EcoRII [Novacetimonas maltaceti]PYD58624.1 restriction endonuclease [Novacetimonas maltaceti]
MRRGQLSDQFEGVVAKRLTEVETRPDKSNQHELNGSTALRKLMGDDDRRNIPARFIWVGEEEAAISVDGMLSWYDARRKHPVRTEYRLYYRSNEVTEVMAPGDVFFLAMRQDGSALLIVVPADSTVQNQLLWLFGLDDLSGTSFSFQQIEGAHDPELDFAARYILDELGVEPEEPEANILDTLIEPFGLRFPTTRVFSELARSSLPDVSAHDDPDGALVEWMEREEQLFRRLERRVVAEKINGGFQCAEGADVDGFLAFSLSVQNRRKARAGSALENHLEAVFQANGLRYARGAETENRNKPDFLFPGKAAYADPLFPADRLTMLGSKSTLKDRWRQVLSEAVRIRKKHLLTLEPGISENQTDEMRVKELQLVLPQKLHATFRPSQQAWLMNVGEFIRLVRERQGT